MAEILQFQRPLTPLPLIPVNVLQQTTGVGKSRMYRSTAVRFQNNTKHEGVSVIAVERHDLGQEQLDAFAEEHPNTALVARIWRGRGAPDPEQPGKLMCWRHDEAEEVSAHGLSVESSLCQQRGRKGEKDILCPFYEMCGHQRQREHAHIWFVAHEMLLHEVPEVFGKVLQVLVDEDPLDAFIYGLEKKFEVAVDALTEVPRIDDKEERDKLMRARLRLHEMLVKLPEGPVPISALTFSFDEATEMSRLEWLGKVDVKISPDWDKIRVMAALAVGAHNKVVIRLAELWRLIAQAVETKYRIVVRPIANADGTTAYEFVNTSDKFEFSGCIEIARYILRERDEPLDIWLLNDVSVPELGVVVPVRWDDTDPEMPTVGPTLDDLMLTTGCWLENASDAKRAHGSLITSADALRWARSKTDSAAPYLKLLAGGSVADAFQVVSYRRDAPKTQKARAILLTGLADNSKAWLEARLGKLAQFETLESA